MGSGSGYLTVCMHYVSSGVVYGIEHIDQLHEWSIANISKNHKHLLEEGKLVMHLGDGRAGLPKYGPFTAIHVGAAAPSIP